MITKTITTENVGSIIEFLKRMPSKKITINIDVPDDAIPKMDAESRAWLDSAALDTTDRLAELESDVPKDKLADWHESMSAATKPARYVPNQGIVIE